MPAVNADEEERQLLMESALQDLATSTSSIAVPQCQEPGTDSAQLPSLPTHLGCEEDFEPNDFFQDDEDAGVGAGAGAGADTPQRIPLQN